MLRNQLFQQLHSQVLLLHTGDFLQELGVKQGKFGPHIGEQINDSFALDAVLQQLIDALVDFRKCKLLAGFSARRKANKHCTHCFKKVCFGACLLIYHTAAQGKRLFEQQSLFDIDVLCFFLIRQVMLCYRFAQQEVNAATNHPCLFQVVAGREVVVVKTVEQVAAHFQLFQKLGISSLAHVRVAEVLFVPHGIVVHGLFQGSGDAHIVHYQAAFLITENAIHAGDGLHQVMPGHRLIHIHGAQRRDIKTRQPHIHHDGNFHGGTVVLELTGKFLLVGLVADNLSPFFRVVVPLSHHHAHFLGPIRA